MSLVLSNTTYLHGSHTKFLHISLLAHTSMGCICSFLITQHHAPNLSPAPATFLTLYSFVTRGKKRIKFAWWNDMLQLPKHPAVCWCIGENFWRSVYCFCEMSCNTALLEMLSVKWTKKLNISIKSPHSPAPEPPSWLSSLKPAMHIPVLGKDWCGLLTGRILSKVPTDSIL